MIHGYIAYRLWFLNAHVALFTSHKIRIGSIKPSWHYDQKNIFIFFALAPVIMATTWVSCPQHPRRKVQSSNFTVRSCTWPPSLVLIPFRRRRTLTLGVLNKYFSTLPPTKNLKFKLYLNYVRLCTAVSVISRCSEFIPFRLLKLSRQCPLRGLHNRLCLIVITYNNNDNKGRADKGVTWLWR